MIYDNVYWGLPLSNPAHILSTLNTTFDTQRVCGYFFEADVPLQFKNDFTLKSIGYESIGIGLQHSEGDPGSWTPVMQ